MDLDPTITSIGLGILGIIGIVDAGLQRRQKANENKTDRVGERALRSIIEGLETENTRLSAALDAARRAPPRRTEDAILINSLEAERNLLLRDVKRLLRKMDPHEVDRLRDEGDLESNFAALADIDERIEPGR
jgi:hypothetical protein